MFGGDLTHNALTLAPVYAATSYIADSISILPVAGYTIASGARRRLDPQPALCLDPHVHQPFTRVEWLHQATTSFLLRGNAYGVITKIDPYGRPAKVVWLHPDHVRIDETKEVPEYFYREKKIDNSTLIHIPWYPKPGSIIGMSAVQMFKTQIETGNYASGYGNNWFRDGARPSGHFKYANGPIDPGAAAEIKARFKAAVSNNDFFVSGSDWSWETLSVAPAEAEFLNTIKATANQIAAVFRVNPEDIGGEAGSSLTYSTLELNQINFQVRTLQPIYTRFEHHINRTFPGNQYIKFNPDAIVRADLRSRMEAHKIAMEIGLETWPEGRELEDKAPLTAAEKKAWLEYIAALKPAAKSDTPSPDQGKIPSEGGA
jgi:HK97 family phage portal protein